MSQKRSTVSLLTPGTFKLLDLVGYPKREEDDDKGKEVWALYYVDASFDSALDLIDCALLTIKCGSADAHESIP